MITIKIQGLDKVRNLFLRLSDSANKQLLKGSEEFMRDVQKSAKLRAPKSTGFLADQITIRKFGNSIILDTGQAYYAEFQEFGFSPHYIPSKYFEYHKIAPAVPGWVLSRNAFVFYSLVAKHTPFMFPALQAQLPNLPNKLKNAMKIAIEEARR